MVMMVEKAPYSCTQTEEAERFGSLATNSGVAAFASEGSDRQRWP